MPPYEQRIQDTRQRIRRNPGDDSRLRERLARLRERRGQRRQDQRPPTQMPWSGQYETDVGRLGRDRDFEMSNLAADEASVRREYGFDDPSNPFSRARELQAGFERAQRGTGNNYAASGQLYAGSLSNARNIDRTNFERSYNQEQTQYQEMLRDLAQRRLGATREHDEGVLAAEAQRLEDALQEPTDPQEAPGRRRRRRRNR